MLLWEGDGKQCGNDIADDKWFMQAMRIMGHAVKGQDSNLINNGSNTEDIEYNCDQSINKSITRPPNFEQCG